MYYRKQAIISMFPRIANLSVYRSCTIIALITYDYRIADELINRLSA